MKAKLKRGTERKREGGRKREGAGLESGRAEGRITITGISVSGVIP